LLFGLTVVDPPEVPLTVELPLLEEVPLEVPLEEVLPVSPPVTGVPVGGRLVVPPLETFNAPTVNATLLKPQWAPLLRAMRPLEASLGTVICTEVLLIFVTMAS
jgi:hypothetical protein